MQAQYQKLNLDIQEQIKEDRASGKGNPFRCRDDDAIRRNMARDKPNLWRPPFVRDSEKILHLPVYNRYADKTQVFSFFRNDDITRRALHVQLVSRIARSIGSVLNLNTDLIESISLGHDIGHTPFGHAGERFLSDLLFAETGLYFNHNVHSVRILDRLFNRNITFQTLDGILCHNGEFEMQEYRPRRFITADTDIAEKQVAAFSYFDRIFNECSHNGDSAIKTLVPTTLEACIVRICDMIAYLGKDRQDAVTAKIVPPDITFSPSNIGETNASIINNLTVDIINNSYGKDYILLSPTSFEELKTAKKENYQKIYHNPILAQKYDTLVQPMFRKLFYRLLDDIQKKDASSVIWRHHIEFMYRNTKYYAAETSEESRYEDIAPELIVTDFIASMTDDYFIDLFAFLFPDEQNPICYTSYFSDIT